MNRKRSLIRAGAVLAVALSAGHLVQTLSATESAEAPLPEKVELASAGAEAAPPVLADIVMPPLPAPLPPLEMAALTGPESVTPAVPPVAAAPPVAEAGPIDCTPALTLTAAPGAMISLALYAPCQAGGRVVLRHAGLVVAESLDAGGALALDLPAFDAAGVVSALLPDASIATAAVAVPDLAGLRRFAVQWMADDAFQLNGYENGAEWGAPGHASAAAPVAAGGSYLMALGNPTLDLPMLAEVYTWPATAKAKAVIEAAVTDMTCGRELLGETLMSEGGVVTVTELTLAMPDCDAVGDILVLNNLSPDVTLAAAD